MRENRARKNIRLEGYDYSQEGYYFITICTKRRLEILARIELDSVGVAALSDPQKNNKIILTEKGKIAKKYLERYNIKKENVIIDEYIIMPNHIHLILKIEKRVAEGSNPYNFTNSTYI